MRVAVLFSGGKDSTLALLRAREMGHEPRYLATVHSANPESYMYHTPNIGLTVLQSRALGIDLVSKESKGEKEREVEDLKRLLSGLDVEGVVSGAVASRYQKERIERICSELGLESITPLWGEDPESLLKEMLSRGMKIMVTAVCAEGLGPSWLGRILDEDAVLELVDLGRRNGIHLTGEGGEFETAVLDCPAFRMRIRILESEKVWKGDSGFLAVRDAVLEEK